MPSGATAEYDRSGQPNGHRRPNSASTMPYETSMTALGPNGLRMTDWPPTEELMARAEP